MNVDRQQLANAFEAWENGYRTDPSKFRTEDEVKLLDVSQVSEERADYFWQLLHELP